MEKIVGKLPAGFLVHLILIGLFAYGFQLIFIYDWDAGFERGIVLLAIVCFISLKNSFKLPQIEGKPESALLYAALIGLLCWHAYYFFSYYGSSYPNDVGEMTLLASELLWKSFGNPYTNRVVEEPFRYPGLFFQGYKFPPLNLFLYSPLALTLKVKGLYISNLLFHILTVIYIYKISNHLNGIKRAYHPAVPVILYLSSYLVLYELFRQGVNDILPTLLMLISIYYFLKGSERRSALFLGASLCTKWLPGFMFGLLLVSQVKDKKRFVLYSAGIFALIVCPFLIWNYEGFISNTILIYALKPGDSTGFLFGMNEIAAKIILVWFALLFLVVALYYYVRKRNDRVSLIFFGAVLLTLFLIPLKENHGNHQIWLIPFFSISFNLLPLIKGRASAD